METKWLTPADLVGRDDIPWWVVYIRHGIGVWDPRHVRPVIAGEEWDCYGNLKIDDDGRSWSKADGCKRTIQPGEIMLEYFYGRAEAMHEQCVKCGRAFAPRLQVVFDLDPDLAVKPSDWPG